MTLTGNSMLVDPGFDSPPDNPFLLLEQWLQEAHRLKINEPRGVVLSTVDASNRPSSRVVLLRDCNDTGFTFITRQESAKGRDLKGNP